MPRDGSGVYTPPAGPLAPAVARGRITAAAWNALFADISTALTDSISRHGVTTASTAVPFDAGIKLGNTWLWAGSDGHPRWSTSEPAGIDDGLPVGVLAMSTTNPGYVKLASGDILQFGLDSTGSANDLLITFPIVFPTALRALHIEAIPVNPGEERIARLHSAPTTSGFRVNRYNTSGAASTASVRWLAIGR